MQSIWAEIQLMARAHQYRLHPLALKGLSEYLFTFEKDIEKQRDALRELFAFLHKLCALDRFVDEKRMRLAIEQQLAKDKGASEESVLSVLVIGLEDTPRVYMDEQTEEIRLQPTGHHSDRFTVLRQRYLFARRRCLRSGLFRRDLGKQECLDNNLPPLLTSIALEGIDSSENVAVLGMIFKRFGEVFLEDLHGCIGLIFREDVCTSMGIVGDGFLVVAKGQWRNGVLVVFSIELPPAERREDGIRDIGTNLDLFGHRPSDFAAAFAQEKNTLRTVVIVMSHVYLDQPTTLGKLTRFFKEMQNRTEGELMDTTLVMVGGFSSTPINHDDVSHLSEPFGGSDRYKMLMDTLATVITTHAPTVAQHIQLVLIPGPNDVTALMGLLPQPPIVSTFGKMLHTRLKKVVFASNPSRMRFFTHEMVIFRRDFFRFFQESGRVFDWPGTEKTTSITSFERVAKTVLDEAHLAPDVKDGILWKAESALTLPILPHLLVLCDSTEQWECTYKGVHVVNPGSFSLASTFLWYTPADGECGLSIVE